MGKWQKNPPSGLRQRKLPYWQRQALQGSQELRIPVGEKVTHHYDRAINCSIVRYLSNRKVPIGPCWPPLLFIESTPVPKGSRPTEHLLDALLSPQGGGFREWLLDFTSASSPIEGGYEDISQ
jgi:hypothetical protein